jgi:hypothetical protein
MEFINNPPPWLKDISPDGAQYIWWGILGFGALVVLLLLWALLSKFLGLFSRKPAKPKEKNLEEDLADYPPLPPSTGDRRLLVEGVPVRLRLVVAAPAGKESRVSAENIEKVLDRVLSGLGDIVIHDRPRVKIWPMQLSYEGFANTFHNNTTLPEGEDAPSRWVMVAGRAMVGKQQILLGLGLQAIKPTTVGRKTLKAHEWESVLRVRVPD